MNEMIIYNNLFTACRNTVILQFYTNKINSSNKLKKKLFPKHFQISCFLFNL